MYEFYKTAKNEEKDEAEDAVETGCRHFISHLLGEDVAEVDSRGQLSSSSLK